MFPALGLAVVCGLLGGCAHRVYRVSNLPAEYLAPHRENVEAVDLSRLNNIAVSSETVNPGDVLEVTMVTDFAELKTLTTPVRVADDGAANIPLVGPVPVAGKELVEAEQAVVAAAIQREVFRTPNITLTMKRQRKNRVTVTGAVQKPGVYQLPSADSTVLAALVAAGGLTKEAGPDVEVRDATPRQGAPSIRGSRGPRIAGQADGVEPVSYQAEATDQASAARISLVSANSSTDANHYVADGATVSVGKRTLKPIQVLGLVGKPGQYEMPLNQDLYLMDALAMAGGRTNSLADRVILVREVPGQIEPVRIQASIRAAMGSTHANLRLAPGDVVSVEETPLTFLWDATKTFVRVGISGGITLF